MSGLSPSIGLQRLSTPGANAVAILFGLEALSRGVVATVLPLQTVDLMGSDEALSASVLAGAVFAIIVVLLAPSIAAKIGRARMATMAAAFAITAVALFIMATPMGQVFGFIFRASAVALLSVSFNLFIMDHIKRGDLGKSEPLRMLGLGVGWMVGPILGVFLDQTFGPAAPYICSGACMTVLVSYFWILRRKGPKVVSTQRPKKFQNPLKHIGDFIQKPRLLHAYLNSTFRSFFWLSFLIYTPVYADAIGLGRHAGGVLQSLGTAFMLAMPLWGWLARRWGIRHIATLSFSGAAIGCFIAWYMAGSPYISAAGLMLATFFMSVNDGYGNALFFRACRPSQRDRMASVFSSYRDGAELFQAALFAALLSFAPIEIVFLVLTVTLSSLAILSRTIHPRL